MKNMMYKGRRIRHLVSGPFIYAMIIPSVIFDFCLELYHHICFPLYKIEMIDRSKYIKVDRHRLKYLRFGQKIGCAYCGYVNGLICYAQVIAAKTEEYWCGIRHSEDPKFIEPEHHNDFIEYGDEEAYESLKAK